MGRIKKTTKQRVTLKHNGQVFDDQQQLEEIVFDYFSGICASENSYEENDLVSWVILKLVIDDNAMIINVLFVEEVKNAIFSLNGDGAPSPDRYGGCFFQHFCHIVATNVYKSMLQFFTQGWITPNLNSNMVLLIPKFHVLIV